MLLHTQGLCFPHLLSHIPPNPPLFLSPISLSFHRPKSITLSAHNQSEHPWLAQVQEDLITVEPPLEEGGDIGGGPIELPSSISSIFATTDDPTPLQISTSLLLTGAISVFLFRSLRRRAKRAKELKFRSNGAKKSLKEEALQSLNAMKTTTLDDAKSPPSPIQALFGGITAGIIALLLYKFTLTVEAGLTRQPLSDNFSVRQITVTIRTIINGLCYLATFVFGMNAIGLTLYSGQLAINSFMEDNESDREPWLDATTTTEALASDENQKTENDEQL